MSRPKRAEESKTTPAFLQSVLDGVNHPIMVIGKDYRVQLMNRAAKRFSFGESEPPLPMRCHQVSHHRDSPCVGAKHPCPLKAVSRSGQPVTLIHEHFLSDGKRRYVELSASPLTAPDGQFEGIVESARDITEARLAEQQLRASERKFHAITSVLGDGVYVVDKEGRLVFLNPAAQRMLGWTESELRSRDVHETVHYRSEDGLPIPRRACPVLRIRATGATYRTDEDIFTRKDGTTFPVAYVATPIKEKDDVVGVVTVFQDVTDRKHAEDDLRRTLEQQAGIARQLQEFLIQPTPDIAGVDIGVAYDTAFEAEMVGGDFYEVFEIERNVIAILIGDVSGKGVRAAGVTETIRSAIRTLAYLVADPPFIFSQANRVLMQRTAPGQFATAAMCVLDVRTGLVRYTSAGHPPALVCRPPGRPRARPRPTGGSNEPRQRSTKTTCRFVDAETGPPLGLLDTPYYETRLNLQEGDSLVFYTDGLTEARRGKRFYGEKRVLDTVSACGAAGAEEVSEALLRSAREFATSKLKDDIAVVTVRLGLRAAEQKMVA